jgi:GTP cyclohydrolase II
VASEDGDPDFVVDDQQENLNPSAQEQIAEADEKSSGTIVYPRKRGRTAARDVQLASQVANDRMADCDDPKLA